MKNQSTKYLLGLALLTVWGLLGFRVYQKYSPTQLSFHQPERPAPILTALPLEPFSLLSNYRDPFASHPPNQTAMVNPVRPTSKKPPAVKLQVKEASPPAIPELSYKGNIALKNGRESALLRVDNHLVNLGKGETYNELKLLQIFDDSIKVSFQGLEQTISKVR